MHSCLTLGACIAQSVIVICAFSGVVRAQAGPPVSALNAPATAVTPAVSAPPAAAPPAISQEEIEKALKADQAATKVTTAPATVTSLPPAPATLSTPLTGAQSSSIGWSSSRGFQSLSLDLSAVLDLGGGYYSDPDHTIKSGDDPGQTGFNVQEIELAFQAVVDPYFRADIFLTIPNLSGLEVEEAFLTTTHLPANFQIKAGIFRASLGRQNTQHLHVQNFTRRPELNAALLGVDGLRAPGLEINWLVPRIPFYLLLAASAFSVGSAGADEPLQTFGGGERYNFTYVGNVKAFFSLSQTASLYLGLNYARGKTSQYVTEVQQFSSTITLSSPVATLYNNLDSNLYGVDLYFKWKPANVVRTYASVAWQSEYFLRQIPGFQLAGVSYPQLEGGLYSQIVVQAARRWHLGLRGEVMGIPSGDNIHREYAGAASITWALSEFARVRLYGEARFPSGHDINGAAFLQLEGSIGAHGAHAF